MNKRIFIVDDDPFWTTLLHKILTELGHTNIITFSNGKECIEKLHLNPELIFLDYQMEEMDGLDVLKKIKEYFPGIGVIFCTAYEDISVAVNAMEYGSYDYLLKENATIREVSNIVENMISDIGFKINYKNKDAIYYSTSSNNTSS
jgi:DNA-binding NtrC family response regulator